MMQKHKFYKGRALDSELRSIYEERGKLPDMTRLEHEYHRRTTRILLGLVLFFGILTAASWGGFFLYGPKSGGGKEVALTLSAPEAVVSGVPQTVTLRYKNTDRNPLAIAAVTLRPSQNLVVKAMTPQPSEEGRLHWNLGTLEAKEEGEIILTVIPYGTIDEHLDLQAIFSYKPANFNAEFQTSASAEFIVRAEGLETTLRGPEKTSPGRKVELTAIIKNTTDALIQNARATLTVTGGFIIQETKSQNETASWEIGTLQPGQRPELTILGTFVTSATGSQPITLLVEEKIDNSMFSLAKSTLEIQVEGSDLGVELILNNTPELTWIRLGQSLQYLLKITNNSPQPMKNVKVSLFINSKLVDFKTAQAENALLKEPMISFPKEGTLTIDPKETKEFSVRINTVSAANNNASPYIEATGQVAVEANTFTSIPVKVIVVSDLALTVEGRYFGADGKPVGSGPLPPKVGEETVYEARLRLHNTFHDLSAIIVTATLPQGVRFVGATSAQTGKIIANEKTGEVSWEIARMPVTTPEMTATFKVAIKPEAKDLGQLLGLLGITRVEAFDTISQIQFSTDAPSVSSNLDGDPSGHGKGVVVE